MSLYLSSLQKFPKSVLYEKVDEKSEKQLGQSKNILTFKIL